MISLGLQCLKQTKNFKCTSHRLLLICSIVSRNSTVGDKHCRWANTPINNVGKNERGKIEMFPGNKIFLLGFK